MDRTIEDLKKLFKWPDEKPNIEPFTNTFFNGDTLSVLDMFLREDAKCVIELGSWFGNGSTAFICFKAPKANVICIDTWLGSWELLVNDEWVNKCQNSYEQFIFNQWKNKDRVIPMRVDTVNGLYTCKDHNIEPDLIYFDSGHKYEHVRAEVSAAYKLFPKAVFVGDDCDEEVFNAVKDALKDEQARAYQINQRWVKAL